ncbi:unnamed protein product [Effrenium voratum]|uniref:Uncharacterized protein n=1 Tax=Effrenium voratum TaxID=2562239 RepID=A0AA36J171_9DINO|nr:unnamed protein product [Effrenium voratum]
MDAAREYLEAQLPPAEEQWQLLRAALCCCGKVGEDLSARTSDSSEGDSDEDVQLRTCRTRRNSLPDTAQLPLFLGIGAAETPKSSRHRRSVGHESIQRGQLDG